MLASELITAIQRCAIGDKEQLQSASELGAIFVSELHQLLVNRPNLQPQTFRQILPAVQYFLNRSLMISAADSGDVLRNANRLLAAAAGFVALAAEQHALMLKDEGTLDLAVQCMASLYNEGRPGMLLEEDMVSAQRSLVSIILECSEASGQGRSDLMMAALRSSVLRDHLCWLWRMGNDSGNAVLAEAALFAEQVLRVLGVEHASLDDMLCQAPPVLVSSRAKSLTSLPVSTTASGSDEMQRTFTVPHERGLRSWFRGAANRKAYTLVMV
ncbi:g3222 [Coccomyxa elongata]